MLAVTTEPAAQPRTAPLIPRRGMSRSHSVRLVPRPRMDAIVGIHTYVVLDRALMAGLEIISRYAPKTTSCVAVAAAAYSGRWNTRARMAVALTSHKPQ